MRIPKRYGQSQITNCPFCGKQATTKSKEMVPVCAQHKNAMLGRLNCLCGEFVYPCSGKWGLYFECPRCGNVNARKIFENNVVTDASHKQSTSQPRPKPAFKTQKKTNSISSKPKKKTIEDFQEEVYIRSDDPRYFD